MNSTLFKKWNWCLVCVATVWGGVTDIRAESAVTVTVENTTNGVVLPDNFTGLSFGMRAMLPAQSGEHFFSPTNRALVTLFQNLGLRHLRMGGTTVESPPLTPIPDRAAIDDLFGFAEAAGVKQVIYSFRLLETNADLNIAATNAALAKYIWEHYRNRLECFALGNEPDLRRVYDQDFAITNFATYIAKWRRFAEAITNAVPGAKFAGPDGGSGNISWTTRFGNATKDSGLLAMVTEHYYAGAAGRGVSPVDGIETMLSAGWLTNYETLYQKMAVPVMADGLAYRFTEANDHYTGGVKDASDTFAGALWALDFLHWWAAHGARGVDFHNTQWVVSDIIKPDDEGQLHASPKGYGLKAFDLGAHGRSEPVTIANADKLNLTAYAWRDGRNYLVTIINKEHSPDARGAQVTISAKGIGKSAEMIYLAAPGGDVASKTGVTLGGATIQNDAHWAGQWTNVKLNDAEKLIVTVGVGTATVVKLRTQ